MNNKTTRSVIIIDDDIHFSKMLKSSLEDCDFICHIANDPVKGIELAIGGDFTIALVDLRMPGKSGIKVIEEIRQHLSELPIIIISGTIDVNEAVNCLREGADDYILKPIIGASELQARINQVLEKYELKKEIKNYHSNLENQISERTRQLIEKTDELMETNLQLEKEIVKRAAAENLVKTGAMNILLAIDRERQRLAQELHDSIGQRLMFTKINLEIAQRELNINNDNFTAANQNLSLISSEIGLVIKSLYPVSIDKYPLTKNLETLISDFEKVSKINVSFDVIDIEPVLNKLTKLNLYRVFQELLNNCAKHSNAANIQISVQFTDNNITISFIDDGTGIPFDFPAEQIKGTGLFSMKERISQLNGKINFNSEKGRGLNTFIEVPL